VPTDEGLALLGRAIAAGLLLAILERDGWTVAISRRFGGAPGDLLIIAASGNRRVQAAGEPAAAALACFRAARRARAERQDVSPVRMPRT